VRIERLHPPGSAGDVRALAALLVEAVESGAAVSFLSPLTVERAEDWWRKTISGSAPGAVFLVARDGSVQLPPDLLPNLPGFQHVSLTPVVSASAETLPTTERACQAKT